MGSKSIDFGTTVSGFDLNFAIDQLDGLGQGGKFLYTSVSLSVNWENIVPTLYD